MLRILDRYIIRQVIAPFAIVLAVFTFMLMMGPIMDVADRLISKGVGWGILFRALWFLVPQALALTIPIALLVGLLVVLGRLSEDREWTALQACGVGLARLARPVGLLALLGWAATSYVMLDALPAGNEAYESLMYGVVVSRAESEVKPRVFFQDFPTKVLYVREVKLNGGGWNDVFLASTGGSESTVYLASRGHLLVDRAARKVRLALDDGHSYTVSGDKMTVNSFGHQELELDPRTVFPTSTQKKGYNARTIAELRADAAEVVRQGFPPVEETMAIHRKFAIPVACLVFGVIALGLGATNRRSGKMASFVTGIAVVFVYWIFMYMAISGAKAHVLPPWLAPWAPNLVLLPVGIALVFWRDRFSDRSFQIPLPWKRRAATATPSALAPARRAVLVMHVPDVWLPRPRLLDWYVLKLYVRIFALAFGGLLGIFYISDFIDLSEKLLRGTATAGMMAAYFWYATPEFVYFVIPLGCLLATLVAIGLLTRNSELIVMRACGISLYRAALPLLVFAAIASVVLFALEEQVLAVSNRRADDLRLQIRHGIKTERSNALNRGWVASYDGNAIYHYGAVNPGTTELSGLTVHAFDPAGWKLASWSSSERARCVSGCGNRSNVPAQWLARNGWTFANFSGERGRQAYTRFRERTIALEPPGYFATEKPLPEQMTYGELRRYIEEVRAGGYDVGPETVWLYRKLAFPFVPLVMTLIAIPFAVTTGRQGAMYGIGIGVTLAVVYWTMVIMFTALGSGGLLTPMLAAWAPNLLFSAGAAYLLLTVKT
jgi:LPS export ABC transporter permease LptG/LPS export ABC transporter permease LptF